MERVEELAIIRRAYAKQILAAVEIDDPSLELAFAQVRREDFLGPGPWVIPRWFGGYLPTPSADSCLPLYRQRRADHRGATPQQWSAVRPCQVDRQRFNQAGRTRAACWYRHRLLHRYHVAFDRTVG